MSNSEFEVIIMIIKGIREELDSLEARVRGNPPKSTGRPNLIALPSFTGDSSKGGAK